MDLERFYVGKFSIYGASTHDVGKWATDSFTRLRTHRRLGAKYRLTFIIALFTDETDALDAEETIAVNLGDAAGIATVNKLPYKKGGLSHGKASGFAIYLPLA